MVIWHKHVIGRHTGPGEVGSEGGGSDDGEGEVSIGDDHDGCDDGEGEVGIGDIDDGDGEVGIGDINFTTVAVDGEVLCLWLQQP